MTRPLHAHSAVELEQLLSRGEVRSVEIVEALHARADEVEPKVGAFAHQLRKQALAEAKAADEARARGESKGALHGLPITIKENVDVEGIPSTIGMRARADRLAGEDAVVVRLLREAGAIVLGKTNVPQTLAVIETDNAPWGRTNNPWNLERSAGGSSGGEAAIIAAGASALGLGGDFGGSLRVPAAYCGLCTLRPTARRLPGDRPPVRTAEGAEALVAQPGPLARQVSDVVLGLRVMVDHVAAQPNGLNPPLPWRAPEAVELPQLRVAVLPQVSDWTPAPAIRRALREAAEALRAQGAVVEEWTAAPDTTEGVLLFFQIVAASGFASLRQLLADEAPTPLIRPTYRLMGMPNAVLPLLGQMLERRGERRLSRMLRSAVKRTAAGYLDLLGDRLAYEGRFRAALQAGGYAAILLPALPLPAVRHGDTQNLADFWGATLLFNVLGWPAGVVPVTRVRPGEESDRPSRSEKTEQAARQVEQGSAGLPVGVQVAAAPWREDRVLAVMAALERHFQTQPDFPSRPPL